MVLPKRPKQKDTSKASAKRRQKDDVPVPWNYSTTVRGLSSTSPTNEGLIQSNERRCRSMSPQLHDSFGERSRKKPSKRRSDSEDNDDTLFSLPTPKTSTCLAGNVETIERSRSPEKYKTKGKDQIRTKQLKGGKDKDVVFCQDSKIPIKSPRNEKRTKTIENNKREETKESSATKNQIYDDRIVLGGGLVFHSSPKKTQKSPKKTTKKVLSNKDVEEKTTHRTKDKSKVKPLPPKSSPGLINDEPIEQPDSIYSREMERQRRLEEDLWERKIRDQMQRNNLRNVELISAPATSCGFSGAPRSVQYEVQTASRKE